MIKKLIGPDYPKTSCDCSECPASGIPKWPAKPPDSSTNNLGLNNRDQLRKISSCASTSFVSSGKQPSPWVSEEGKKNIEILNPNFGLEVSDGFFHEPHSARCACGTCKKETHRHHHGRHHHGRHHHCEKETPKTVTAYDSRLIYPLHGSVTQQLDSIPYTGEVRLKNIYDEKYTDYGKHYKNYSDIHAGQYMYYLDRDIEPTYSLPVYTVRSQVNSEVYQTPMGSLWPRYPKVPTTKDSRYLSPQQFTRDTVKNREDLMALQMARFNREKYPLDMM
jgi:hypothetical protein